MKKALVIGGTTGIGAAIVKELSEKSYDITVISRKEPENPVDKVNYLQLDVLADEAEWPDMGDQLDALVYCPGSINLKPFDRLKPKEFADDFEINALGAVKAIQHYVKTLKGTKGSSITLFSTVAVQTGLTFHASVAAAKGAVEGLTRSLAAELAPDVRVNALALSLTDTPLARRLLRTDNQREASVERHPLKKIGTPEEVGIAASFVIDEAPWMTGQVLKLDGGMSAVRGL